MTDESRERAEDALLHRWLDGGLGPEETAELQRRLARDPVLAQHAAALRSMETWLQDTRPVPRTDVAPAVMRAIEQERSSRLSRAWIDRLISLRAVRIGAPLAAAAALVLLLAVHGGRLQRPLAGDAQKSSAPQPADSQLAITPPVESADSVRCVFQLEAENARRVCLVGSFNLWKVCDMPLHPSGGGKWTVTVELPRGRHEYTFYVDGRWVTDPAARLRVDDGFGGENGILLL